MTLRLIELVEAGHILAHQEAEAVMEELLSGHVETPETVRLLEALNRRPLEVAGTCRLWASDATTRRTRVCGGRGAARQYGGHCGTGGDGSNTFNISTAAAIVVAAPHARCKAWKSRGQLAKRIGRRAGKAGGTDRFAVGAVWACHPGDWHRISVRASRTHGDRHAAPARKQMGVRTVFNLLGPLTNPAGRKSQVLGVVSAEVIDLVAATLAELVWSTLCGAWAGGLDEISLAGETLVAEVHGVRSGASR